MVFKR
jgi:hypothetical protein